MYSYIAGNAIRLVYNYDYLIMLDACNKLRTLAPTMKNFNVSWHLPYFLAVTNMIKLLKNFT